MRHCVVSPEDPSLASGSLPERGGVMARSATNDDGVAGRAASESEDAVEAEDPQLNDAPKAFPDSEEEGDEGDADDDEETELEHAARAGIRLLEENAQLQEELRHLQEQCARVESEKEELLRLVAEKDEQEAQLSEHLRESIRENQSILSELSKAKEQIDELKDQLEARSQAQAKTNRSSPGKRRGKRSSPRLKLQLQLDPSMGSAPQTAATEDPPSSEEPSPAHSGGSPEKQEFMPVVRRNSMPPVLEGADVEAKFEEAHRRNSVLGRELASAQRQIGELKPLQLQLREAELEVQLLRVQVEDQAREIALSTEEREEERELIDSLRHTIEIYQILDDPCTTKLDEMRSASARDDDIPVSPRSSPRRGERSRRRVDVSTAPSSHLLPADFSHPALDDRFSLRDENDRLLAELDHLGQQVLNLKLLEGISRTVRSPKKPPQDGGSSFANFVIPTSPENQNQTDSAAGTVGPVGYGTSSRMRFLEQQSSVLQDLLRRFRVQWKYECVTRRAAESDKADLLQRMEKMQELLSPSCEKEREELLSEGDDTSWENSAAVYETLMDHTAQCQTKEEQAEAEHICFSILRRLVDSWTTDKAKRMRLHDWLTNAIRGTGKRRPLYLYELSGEIASGFQVLLVPILREKFGVQVQVEKRLRNVIVTDLKMEVTGADAAKAKACLQRISRSLLWLIDVESALIEDQDWVGEFARRKAAKMCANI
ncbi:hypothetical protein PR003_g25661 [Phytophthora rubi]|uniref:G protein gamma domain-containing protein n=1 Tax=Phytophthora rubi TaxID=129364 RepID=A0A6A3IE65_9STRA|nr:hypothetical protein PR002_g24820 [Phytophthora rubi]KAE8980009.1 hypothetical protein PR001_g24392 [Phytophthora rubi]KAE9289032.1 hypothetical protein PR003_g25661 [Phytophthora rubi]